ncbi:MAG TPA: hypothetical protein ENH94_01740, partial [Phycisphaerales bacterium]|nr:hypothetical protein [Phycisphaerales bacterium]
MNAEQVVEKILSDARGQAEKLVAEASEKASGEDVRLQDELAVFQKETERLAKAAAADRKLQKLATARMDIRKQMLVTKAGLLDDVFAQARGQINSLPDNEYQKLITSLMEKAAETGDEEVVIGKNETRIDNSLIKQINRNLGTGFKGNLHLASDRADIDGGFILRRGKIQLNVSTDVLLSQV